jgi:hypothetical protein
VLANSNDASIGDATLQPVRSAAAPPPTVTLAFADQLFRTTTRSMPPSPDRAPALTTRRRPTRLWHAERRSATATTTAFDNKNALLNQPVQKYGRTTKLTHGTITGINATLSICYEVLIIFCVKSATFVDQLVIEPGTFSGGGDSGSLIVTDDINRNPVALLFAGSSTQTIGNRIDLVLSNFNVQIDAGPPPPPPPPVAVDVAVQSVNAPTSVTVGNTANVLVTIRNGGTDNITSTFDVTLRDATDNIVIGTQSVAGLASGATTTQTYAWNTTGRSIGAHTLTAQHNLPDENSATDQASAVVTVNPQSTGMHVGNLTGIPSNDGTSWSAVVEIAVHDAAHNPVDGVTVVGDWTPNSFLVANTCTTCELGGVAICIVLYPGSKQPVGELHGEQPDKYRFVCQRSTTMSTVEATERRSR